MRKWPASPSKRSFSSKAASREVNYRAHCHNLALKHGVTGYAKNMADGSVEILACGTGERIDAFAKSLRTSKPIGSRVDIITEMSRKVCTAPAGGFQRL